MITIVMFPGKGKGSRASERAGWNALSVVIWHRVGGAKDSYRSSLGGPGVAPASISYPAFTQA